MQFEATSYNAHQDWFGKQYSDDDKRWEAINSWMEQKKNHTINYYIQNRLLELIRPLLNTSNQWITVGDGYGFDANYLFENKQKVVATDISPTFLEMSKQAGLLEDFSIENAEKLSFADNHFDYALCKEAYHHFPRPYMAVYEMLRVVKKGIILIEPHDPLSKMPFLLALRNILDNWNVNTLQKYWKNRYSFEEVGNYVFKLSERECEKMAMGINLPAIAFKGINNNYYKVSIANESYQSSAFKKLQRKIRWHNLLCKLTLMPYQVLSAIIFKQTPDEQTIASLKKDGYRVYILPKNPYLK
ncbi:methyltransferase type 11 [bacterium 336/3]|nr:methyltransferase type 11 [bacterium 336/3]